MAMTSKKDPDFFSLTHEVQKLTNFQFDGGKESEGYKKQHVVCLKLIKELNSIYGKGFASLGQAREVLAISYIKDKGKSAKSNS